MSINNVITYSGGQPMTYVLEAGWSGYSGWAWLSGTAMAAPHVAAAAAYVADRDGLNSPVDIENTVRYYASDYGATQPVPNVPVNVVHLPASMRTSRFARRAHCDRLTANLAQLARLDMIVALQSVAAGLLYLLYDGLGFASVRLHFAAGTVERDAPLVANSAWQFHGLYTTTFVGYAYSN